MVEDGFKGQAERDAIVAQLDMSEFLSQEQLRVMVNDDLAQRLRYDDDSLDRYLNSDPTPFHDVKELYYASQLKPLEISDSLQSIPDGGVLMDRVNESMQIPTAAELQQTASRADQFVASLLRPSASATYYAYAEGGRLLRQVFWDRFEADQDLDGLPYDVEDLESEEEWNSDHRKSLEVLSNVADLYTLTLRDSDLETDLDILYGAAAFESPETWESRVDWAVERELVGVGEAHFPVEGTEGVSLPFVDLARVTSAEQAAAPDALTTEGVHVSSWFVLPVPTATGAQRYALYFFGYYSSSMLDGSMVTTFNRGDGYQGDER